MVQKTGSSLREAQNSGPVGERRMVGRGISSYGALTFIIGGLSFCSRGSDWVRDDHIHGILQQITFIFKCFDFQAVLVSK